PAPGIWLHRLLDSKVCLTGCRLSGWTFPLSTCCNTILGLQDSCIYRVGSPKESLPSGRPLMYFYLGNRKPPPGGTEAHTRFHHTMKIPGFVSSAARSRPFPPF